MQKKLCLIITLVVFLCNIALSETHKSTKRLIPPPMKNMGTEESYPNLRVAYPPYNPPQTDEIVGDTTFIGTTWYDIQHNNTCGRMIQVDNDGWKHMVWMNGLNNGASLRHIFYQLIDPQGNLQFTNGVQVDQSVKAGYTTLALHPDDRAMPCFHQSSNASPNYHTTLAFDYFPRTGAFQAVEFPWVYQGGLDLEIIWPKISRDINDRYHIVSTENPLSGVAGDPQRIYYCGAEFDPLTYNVAFDTEQQEVTWTMIIAADVASSPVSTRSAVAWLGMCATGSDTTQYDNDLILCLSDDGVNWDWSDTINVTNWIPPDLSLLPDTILANKDTLRCYSDISLVFDYNDVLHVFFTTRGFYSIQGTLTWGNGFLWHWDELNQAFSLVASGWFDNGFYDPGAWSNYVMRPSGAVDPVTGDIYCIYNRAFHPVGVSPAGMPFLIGDTTDFSAAGWPNGEIWVSRSTDEGYTWSEGIDITNTHSPNAISGACLSEITPSMAPEVYDDKIHLMYVLDADAGAVVQNEGTWTLNNMVYHSVETADIPTMPLLQPYPMHCDSSGMPGWTPPPQPEIEITLTPETTPVVIPAGGGSFNFDLGIANVGEVGCVMDVWTNISLPGGAYYPIVNRENINFAIGASILRPDLTQFVPAQALGGVYSYNAYVRNHLTWELLAEDSFNFTKEAPNGSANHNNGWALYGWDGDAVVSGDLPAEYSLHPAYPNPFNPETTLSFSLPDAGNISLVVYDITGREITRLAEGYYQAGIHASVFDGHAISSGVYFARLDAGGKCFTEKLLLIK